MALAGHHPPPATSRTDQASPILERVLDQLDTPAMIVSDLGVTLRQNALADALIGAPRSWTGLRRSLIYRWFTDPDARRIHPQAEHEMHSRNHVASLRAVHGRVGDDPEAQELVEHLLRDSEEFAALWERHEVGKPPNRHKHFVHPLVGTIALDCQILVSESNVTERLVVFTARPGSEDADRLALLSVVGTQQFAGAAASG